MERKEEQLKDDIKELNELIKNLKLTQQQINSQIQEAEKIVTSITNRDNKTKQTINNRNNKLVVFEYGDIRVGDRVRIRNPSGNQQNKGTIIGATKTGFARIQTQNGDIIRRVANNITKIR